MKAHPLYVFFVSTCFHYFFKKKYDNWSVGMEWKNVCAAFGLVASVISVGFPPNFDDYFFEEIMYCIFSIRRLFKNLLERCGAYWRAAYKIFCSI